jgi:hypothetical protein
MAALGPVFRTTVTVGHRGHTRLLALLRCAGVSCDLARRTADGVRT